jgi:hypothetical protein
MLKSVMVSLILILFAQAAFSRTTLQTRKSAGKAAKQSSPTGAIASGEDNGYADGSRRNRLVMQRLGTIFLGDEFTGQVKVQTRNNCIRIIGDSALTRESCCGRKPAPEKLIVIK